MTSPLHSNNVSERIIGIYEGAQPGPTVIVTGAVHGNEPAGLWAARAVLEKLRSGPNRLRGRLIAAVGNLAALRVNKRYITRDLNRGWETTHLADIRSQPIERLRHEDREQRELLDLFEPLLKGATEPVVFLDLHTTSGPGAPFVCMSDVIRNRRIAFGLGIPVVLGLEEAIEGSMLGYLCDLGHVGVAVEGGQHEEPTTRAYHEAAVWSVLQSSGALSADDVDQSTIAPLRETAGGLPSVIEIRFRHVCRDGDGFRMVPGYANFQPVAAHEHVASDYSGNIHTPFAGIMMLPRYQGLGEDGYFLARTVQRAWLSISARLRTLGADRVLRGLPGVIPHPDLPEHFRVDPRVARIAATEVFHLLGFRRERPEGDFLVFSRRRPDGLGPEPLPPVSAAG